MIIHSLTKTAIVKKHSVCGTTGKSGNHSGNFSPNSKRHNAFHELLTAAGFTKPQLLLIDDALHEAGLEIRPTTLDC